MADSDAGALRARVQACYERGDLEGALRVCSRLVRAEPESADALNDMGTITFALGRRRESLGYFAGALRLDEGHAEARANLRAACRALGVPLEAALQGETAAPAVPDRADISVVVPVRGHLDVFGRCLDALRAQSFPAERFEVVAVANGMDAAEAPELAGVVERWAGHFGERLRVRRIPEASIPRARNEGIAHAGGRIVLQINQDSILSRSALAEHYARHEGLGFDPRVVIAGGRRFGPDYLRHLFCYLHESVPLYTALHRPRPRFLGDYTWFVTCNLSALREAYLRFGTYEPTLAWGSDQGLGKVWQQEHGCRIYVDTGIVSYHLHRLTFASWKAKCIEGAPYWFRRNMGMPIGELPPAGRLAVRRELDEMRIDPAADEAELQRIEENFDGPDRFAGETVRGQPARTPEELTYLLRPILRDYRKWLQYNEIWKRIEHLPLPDEADGASPADLDAALADMELT
jgi:hypothetical protein